jgi:hypothetical protein
MAFCSDAQLENGGEPTKHSNIELFSVFSRTHTEGTGIV